MKGRVEALRAADPGNSAPVPVDLVTASASGLDPHISRGRGAVPGARVARARGLAPDVVKALIARHTDGRLFGLLGERRVNVLELNLALDQLPRAEAAPSRGFSVNDGLGILLAFVAVIGPLVLAWFLDRPHRAPRPPHDKPSHESRWLSLTPSAFDARACRPSTATSAS